MNIFKKNGGAQWYIYVNNKLIAGFKNEKHADFFIAALKGGDI